MSIKISYLVKKYNLKLVGNSDEILIYSPSSLKNQKPNSISWIKSQKHLEQIKCGIFVISSKIKFLPKENVTYLVSDESPKLIFSKILKNHFTSNFDFYLQNCVDNHRLNKKIKISENVFIGKNVSIGSGTIIFPNVVIEANTVIGENCIIKSHVSIGTEGLGLELDKIEDNLVKFPQIGNVILEKNVEIGPNSTVRRGALDSTIIKSHTKIGSLVNIGHNSIIGKNCILTCNVITGGSSFIGDYCFIGVNSVIKNGIKIGSNSLLGMGSVVTKELGSNIVAYGNPAKEIRKNH
jgi:UDP-3-O-[3-hydroxymyristoyl] glucosamine N-acyltransferase